MDNDSKLQPQLVPLRESLRESLDHLRRRIEDRPRPGAHKADMVEMAAWHLRSLDETIKDLGLVVNRELGYAASNQAIGRADIRRAVSRVNRRLDHLLDDYHEVRRAQTWPEDEPAARMLRNVYRDVLRQIEGWLEDIVECLDDPLAAVKKRGLPTQGNVEITFTLKVETPSQTGMLTRWIEDRNEQLEACERQAERRVERAEGRSLLSLVLLAFGVGWLFGEDE